MDSQLSPLDFHAPFSEEAEQAVIGAVLVNPHAYVNIASFLKSDDFYFLRHNYIWRAMERLHDRSEPIDYLTVTSELDNLDFLDEIGGQAYLTMLAQSVPTSVHVEVYGRLVERTSIRRRLLMMADEIKSLALDEELTLESVLSEAESRLFSVSDTQLKREFVPLSEAVSEFYDRMEQLIQNREEAIGIPSGFRDLDQLLGGLQKSDLVVFAGRPGMGKTSFLLSAAMNAAKANQVIALFTMEMGVEQMVQRMIAMETGINMQKLRLGNLSPQDINRFNETVGRISRLRIFIDDTPALTPTEIRTKARRLQHEYGLDLIMIDYMQLMSAGGNFANNRVQEISYISRNLKEMAKELNVPVMSAAQLSRAVEQRQDKRPLLSDLRESGAIEQDADVVMFLYRDEVYNEATEFPNQAEVIVGKHRNGPTGTINLYFEKSITKFMDGNVHHVSLRDLEE